MAVYNIKNPNSDLASVEFTPVSEGNFTFFSVRSPEKKEEVKQWVTKDLQQEIIAETSVDGKPMLVTHGDLCKDDIEKKLEERGDKLEMQLYKKPINFWSIRGAMSIIGQSLQLTSAFTQVEQLKTGDKRLDPAYAHHNPKLKEGMWVRKDFQRDIGMFAILNLIANAANIAYGGQREEGENRLRHIKTELNHSLADHITADEPPALEDVRSKLRKGPEQPKSAAQKFDEFARENSVRFFEIGLRYLGAMALVFPTNKLGAGFKALQKGSLVGAWNAAKNPNASIMYSGLGYLTGKTLALFAKTPDPYDTKPHTTLDEIREKYLFKYGGLIEAVAGANIGVNAYKTKKVGFWDGKRPDLKPQRDWMGTVGGGLFAGGYVVRYWAPFGSKNVNMEEVYAHATDTLAKTPPAQLPQLMADTAATLKEHFKDKNLEFGQIFNQMMTDMYRYHHIALDNLGTEPDERNQRIINRCLASLPPDQRGPRAMAQCLDGIAAAEAPPHADEVPAPAENSMVAKHSLSQGSHCKPCARKATSFAEKTKQPADAPGMPGLGV